MSKAKKDETTAEYPAPPASARDISKSQMKHLGGSNIDAFNRTLVTQATNTIWVFDADNPEWMNNQMMTVMIGMMAVEPKDELEGMLAAQMVSIHNAAMECMRRAMIPNQSFEGRNSNLNQATKLTRTYTAQMEALKRYRSKGEQKVTVEHVHVHDGGQAIVGNVEGRGGDEKQEGQSHAKPKSVAYAPGDEMRREDPQGDAVPIASGQR